MGVRRAVAIAEEACKKENVYSLGPLIHNPRVINDLKNKGLKALIGAEYPPPLSTLIISAHGVSPIREEELREKGITLLDATCPHVKTSQKTAETFSQKDYHVFLAGEKNHSELKGISAYIAKERCFFCSTLEEAENEAAKLHNSKKNIKTVLIGQTTLKADFFYTIGQKIKKYFPCLEIVNTICEATEKRQNALRKLCTKTDAILVIGGKNSSNTKQLYLLARELGKDAFIAENIEDIPKSIKNYSKIGLCAGASTPDILISEIEAYLKTI